MTTTPLHYDLSANLSAKKFFAKLGKTTVFQIASQHYSIKTFYDSFDWRLYNAQMVCEFNHSQSDSAVSLYDYKSGKLLSSLSLQDVPEFCGQFPDSKFKSLIEEPLEMRALLPLCQLPHQVYLINILNKNEKTVVRLKLEEHETLTHKLIVFPLKGYEKAARKIQQQLEGHHKLTPSVYAATFKEALKLQGRKPGDYSSKLKLNLKPDMSAEKASRTIFKQLLKDIKANEAGTIEDIDTEFLHDFRVAVRRTRAAFSLFKNILPVSITQQYAPFFAWLGQITSLTRDLDVYLLNYPKYKQALPVTLREEITPLYPFLKKKQKQAQKEMAAKLQSDQYKQQIVAWEQYLESSTSKKSKQKHSLTTKELADQRIWKMYRRLLKEGRAIDDDSPAEALHDLRKTGKKLRYLMEFFQSLYPESEIKQLIKALKNFQTVLGDFQDYEVQENNIKHFSEEMMADGVDSNTILAMGVLVQYLDTLKNHARKDFAHQFESFTRKENNHRFKKLFAEKPQEKKS